MTFKEFLSYTNIPYDSLNYVQKTLVDVIDYANEHNLHIIEYRARGGYCSNIWDLYKQMKELK